MISGIKKTFFGRRGKTPHPNNKILTGIPRSGTTLACRLLCQVNNVIALNEPMEPDQFPNRKEALVQIMKSFAQFRNSILTNGTAQARTKDGQLTDNAYDSSKIRKRVLQRTTVIFDKKLNRDFDLIMKHNAGFSLLLPELVSTYPCYAMIRNPLAVLGSWNSVNVPVSRGKVAKSKKLLPAFHKKLEAIEKLYERQLYILSWYFSQFTLLPESNLIRYEQLIKSKGQVLKVITGKKYDIDENLQSRNHSTIYDENQILQLAERLLQSDGAYWEFYSKADVEKLLEIYLNEK